MLTHAGFERLMAAHQRQVYVTAYRLLGNREDAQDAAQEVFVRLYRHLGRVDEARLASWLYRVTVNVCRDIGRARRPAAALNGDPPDATADPLAGLEEAERRAMVQSALRRLSDKQRAAVVLRDLEGLPTREVARILGTAEVTVRSHLSAARLRLKQAIEGWKK